RGYRYDFGVIEPVKNVTLWEIKTSELPKQKPEPKIIPETQIGYSLKVNSGWNLFSVPFLKGKALSSTCKNENIFVYDPDLKEYKKKSVYSMESFDSSYWMKSTQECYVEFNVTSGWLRSLEFKKELKKGWNFINTPYDRVKLTEVVGDCDLMSGPWKYNSESKSWQKSQLLDRPLCLLSNFFFFYKSVDFHQCISLVVLRRTDGGNHHLSKCY
ncbi:hypothetical protein HZC08_00370, partial [Candidatus Micrarchaeota archaeon]|nr:hypothetical protein [Candidatus Micrarchaeota archaeon]